MADCSSLFQDSDLDVAEAGGSGPVADVRGLGRLALTAIRRAPDCPLATDRVTRAPEAGRNPCVRGVFHHRAQFAVPDLPGDLGPKMEVKPPVVDAPALVGLEVDPTPGVGQEVLERPLAWLEVDVGHADQGDAAPAIGPHRAVALLAQPGGRLARSQVV